MIELFYDGACGPVNPGGAMGYGFITYKEGLLLGAGGAFNEESDKNSNNVAEYRGLILGLEWLLESGMADEQIIIRGDNRMTIMQASGTWKANKGLYLEDYNKCKELVKKFSNLSFMWIPREKNEKADEISKYAMSKKESWIV
jgi:ribonuclease HI